MDQWIHKNTENRREVESGGDWLGFVRIYTNIYNPYIGVPSAILGGDTSQPEEWRGLVSRDKY